MMPSTAQRAECSSDLAALAMIMSGAMECTPQQTNQASKLAEKIMIIMGQQDCSITDLLNHLSTKYSI